MQDQTGKSVLAIFLHCWLISLRYDMSSTFCLFLLLFLCSIWLTLGLLCLFFGSFSGSTCSDGSVGGCFWENFLVRRVWSAIWGRLRRSCAEFISEVFSQWRCSYFWTSVQDINAPSFHVSWSSCFLLCLFPFCDDCLTLRLTLILQML